jgi:hypothetical protein
MSIFIKKYWPLIILLIFFGWLFWNLFSTHMLEQKSDGLYSGGSTWGDLALHTTLSSNFYEKGLMRTLANYPIYSGEKTRYPFLMDYITTLLMKIGLSLRISLIWPSFIFILCFIVVFYLLAQKMTKSRLAAFFAPLIFFFNGSIFSLQYFWQDFKVSGLSLFDFLGKMTKEYGHLADYKIYFSNIIADYILPQRAIILGLLVGTIVIYFLWQYWKSKETKKLIYAGVITGFLPVIHTHTFISIILVAFGLGLMELIEHYKDFKHIIVRWLYYVIPVGVIALPFVLWLFPSGSNSFFKISIGWMRGEEFILWFWLKNLGVYILAFIAGYAVSGEKLRKFYWPFLGLFIITNIFIFQPHYYDNMKIMLWWFLLSAILTGKFLSFLKNRFGKKGFVLIAITLFLLIPTGFLSVYRETYVSWKMFSNEDIALADFVRVNTSKDALFLTSDKHNHPIPCLAGRSVVMGYRGWLWTHGINYTEKERNILDIYHAEVGYENLLVKYGINYILLEKNKTNDLGINYGYYMTQSKFQPIYESDNYLLFKVSQ